MFKNNILGKTFGSIQQNNTELRERERERERDKDPDIIAMSRRRECGYVLSREKPACLPRHEKYTQRKKAPWQTPTPLEGPSGG